METIYNILNRPIDMDIRCSQSNGTFQRASSVTFCDLLCTLANYSALCSEDTTIQHTWSRTCIMVERYVYLAFIRAVLKLDLRIGSFHQVFDRNGWDFHRMLYEKYGSVAKLRMVLGVG